MCGIVAALPAYHEQLLSRPAFGARVEVPQLLSDDLDSVAATALCRRIQNLARETGQAAQAFARPWTAAAVIADELGRRDALGKADELSEQLVSLDRLVDARSREWGAEGTECVQVALREARDAAYALRHDRLGVIADVCELRPKTARAPSPVEVVGYLAIAAVLSALDRLEVRGRDSAGVGIRIELDASEARSLGHTMQHRLDPLLRNRSVRVTDEALVFVYKHAAVVGQLGHNGAQLRAAIRADDDLHRAMRRPSARVSLLAHTRWASVGRISEANAHPVDNDSTAPLVLAALNGDIDNHVAVRARYRGLDEEITTDAKLIPLLLDSGAVGPDAMAACLRQIDGSTAIGALLSNLPGGLLLGVKGSGQGLYVGASEYGYFVASEVYGLVATSDRYLRLDGSESAPDRAGGTVVELSRDQFGSLGELCRFDGDGMPQPVASAEWLRPEITSRDLALGGAKHYLQKELAEASSSFRKTLRGRIRTLDGDHYVELPPSCVPPSVIDDLSSGKITRLAFIGQGTAAVACQGIAEVVRSLLSQSIRVNATPATEFSAYGLERDLSGTCVIAVSQSGSTTDTNRAVDLARARGAKILSIVNRRDSDLAAKSDGVVYTADGRDVEMAVASTKAFYAQIAAGCLLGLALARAVGGTVTEGAGRLIRALRAMPDQLDEIGRDQHAIATIAGATATRYQNWAVVGSGPNRVAAYEARIKLSELCYRTVSTDTVEDKKHIDLSAESLVLVCAAGTPPGQLRDLVKEVEIFSAHRNMPVVITDRSDEPWATPYVVRVPTAHPALAWILSTAAAHLFSYYAALSIDLVAAPLRAALGAFEANVNTRPDGVPRHAVVQQGVIEVLDRIASGDLAGVVSPTTISGLTALAAGVPAASMSAGTAAIFAEYAADPLSFIRTTLTRAIDELTRPIDAVKHQAKTVTVGTSRDDSDLYDNDLVRELDTAGMETRSSLSHPVLRALRAYAPLVSAVSGVTRYRLRGEPANQIVVTRRVGVATRLVSRAQDWGPLTGSKELVVRLRLARLLRGAYDRRLVLVVPEQEGMNVVGVAVLHIEFVSAAPGALVAAGLSNSGSRLDEIRAAVTESGEEFRMETLDRLPIETALLAPVENVAAELRRGFTRVA